MKTNVGSIDRWMRMALGVVLMALAATGTIGAWGFVGVVPVLTGALGYCPAYSLFGFSSCPLQKR